MITYSLKYHINLYPEDTYNTLNETTTKLEIFYNEADYRSSNADFYGSFRNTDT